MGGQDEEEEQEEFDFPLFSMGTRTTTEEGHEEEGEDRGRAQTRTNVMRITLRSPSPEIIIQERPKSYYFTENDEETKQQFKQCAVTGDDIIRQSSILYGSVGKKVMNLNEHNAKIERELQRNKRSRPGKKKRLATIEARKNNSERSKVQKQQEAKAKAKLMKKIHHKRGGKKHKKNAGATTSQPAKPKYRTE